MGSLTLIFLSRIFFLSEFELEDVCFLEDEAAAHTARILMKFLTGRLPGGLISLEGDLNWLARLPDLASCDFFLWGYLKSKIYNDHLRTLEAPKNNIRANTAETPDIIFQREHENFRRRLEPATVCTGRRGPFI